MMTAAKHRKHRYLFGKLGHVFDGNGEEWKWREMEKEKT
jgi:hypothetical protein